MNLIAGSVVVGIFLLSLAAFVLGSRHRSGRVDWALVVTIFLVLFFVFSIAAATYVSVNSGHTIEGNIPALLQRVHNR